jgi:GGDEF domain-containing protein
MLQVIDQLLYAIVAHAPAADPTEHEAFQTGIQQLREVFRQPSVMAMQNASRRAGKMFEDYNKQAVRFLRAHSLELQKLLSAFIETLAAVSTASESSMVRLRDLEKQILKASSAEEVKGFSARLAGCLESLRDQTLSQRERTEQNVVQLRRDLESARPACGPAAVARLKIDSLSGLSLRAQAEKVLDAAIQAGGHGFAVAFVVDRVHLINARFGYAVGDQILLLFSEHLAQHLNEGDQLFRWTGPVFLVLMDRPDLPDGVRTEVKRVTSKKLETTVQIGTRSVLLPVTSSAAIFSMLEADSSTALIEKIDTFVAEHSRR